MQIFIKNIALLLILSTAITAQAQQPRFYKDIQQFKRADSIQFPAKGTILFIGSSSFTKWKDVQEYFPKHKITNRGFGGSTLPDLIRYVDDIVFPYHPKQVVIYCGENDLAASDTVSGLTVAQRFSTLFNLIRARLPHIPIVYISMKPSPSREHLMQKMDIGNYFINAFLKENKRSDYIDVYHLMVDGDGKPRKELFIQDMLHMNSAGYAIWKKALEPYLK